MRNNASPATPVLHQNRPNVLPLEGDIDLHVSPAVTESLNAMIKKKPKRIVVDLSRATYIDSAGMAALILAMQDFGLAWHVAQDTYISRRELPDQLLDFLADLKKRQTQKKT